MTRARAQVVGRLLVATSAVALAVLPDVVPVRAQEPALAPVTLTLARQSWFLPGNGNATLNVRLDTTGVDKPERRGPADRSSAPRVQIEIEAHDPIATRAQMDAFIATVTAVPAVPPAGAGTSTDDQVADDTSSTTIVNDRSIVDTVRVDLADTSFERGRIDLDVVVEPEDDDPDQLAMPQQGIHPLVIRVLRDGEVAAQIPTFVERLAWGTTEPPVDGVTELSVMGLVDAAPTLMPSGATDVDDTAVDELTRVRATLDDLPDMPITLAVRPELVEGLDRSNRIADRGLVDDLATVVGERPVMSQPFVGMDPSSMVAVGLDDVYVDELRRGEDALTDALPRSTLVRSVAVATSPVTAAGADLLRDLGVRSVVLLGDADAGAPATTTGASTGASLDASLATEIPLPTGGTLQAHTVDADIARWLSDGVEEPALAANHLVADALLRQRELTTFGVPIDGRSLVLTTLDGALPDASMLKAVAALVDEDPRLDFTALDLALGRTDVLTEAGSPVQRTPAAAPAVDLAALATDLAVTNDDVATTGSMLPSGDPRLLRWKDLVQIAPSDALDADARAAYLDTVMNETAALRASVLPPPETTFTLGGRSGDVTLSLRNDADVALTVVVRMTSPKLLFPEAPPTVELAPESTTIVRIPVQARSNNTFPVTVEVLTPWQLRPVTAPVQLTARVTAYTGLGQVVTGGALLVLATWWVRHWRTNRRRRLAAPA